MTIHHHRARQAEQTRPTGSMSSSSGALHIDPAPGPHPHRAGRRRRDDQAGRVRASAGQAKIGRAISVISPR